MSSINRTPMVHRYEFNPAVRVEEIQAAWIMATFACESLFGEARVRLDAAHTLDQNARVLVIDCSTKVGESLNCLFVGFVTREFGPDSFSVTRIERKRAA